MLLLCKVDDIIANQYVIAMVGEWFDGSSHQPAEVQHQYDASYPYSHLMYITSFCTNKITQLYGQRVST